MQFQPFTIYHQEYQNGDREYFLSVKQYKNGRWHGYRTTGNRKPVKTMGDPTVPAWLETPAHERPRKLLQLANALRADDALNDFNHVGSRHHY